MSNIEEKVYPNDHRVLGRQLGIFAIDDQVGQGLILWLPRGAIIRQELQNFISEELRRADYQQVFTPHIGRLSLYRTSGHYPFYKESQFSPIPPRLSEENCSCAELAATIGEEEADSYLLKPMNCPHHIRIFAQGQKSYRDLPVRLAEFGTVYRWEQSGALGGMTRVRGFTQDDAHIFCSEDQIEKEIANCLKLVLTVFQTMGIKNFSVRLSLRDKDSDKYVGAAADWDKAEESLRRALESFSALGISVFEAAGEAAFYGPKIDFIVHDPLGREWQLGTIQIDYNLPKRFNLFYIGEDNERHCPVMIHRAPFGSMERFVGLLIEHFAGHFPLWLAPEQVRILPVSEKSLDYALSLLDVLKDYSIRAAIDDSANKIGAKIRAAQLDKTPYMLIVGEKEKENYTVSVRHFSRVDLGEERVDSFLEKIQKEILQKSF